MRRTEVAFADAQGVWGRAVASGTGQRYVPADLVFFTRAAVTPCAGGGAVSGPFYCAETGTAGFDLAFLATMAGRLQRQEDLGLALIAARLSAEHLQRELGILDAAALRMIGAGRGKRAAVGEALDLQADCLTGAWAAAAGKRLGPVPAGLLGPARLVLAQRRGGSREPGRQAIGGIRYLRPRQPGRPPGGLQPRLCRQRPRRLPGAGRDRRPQLSRRARAVRAGRGPAARATRGAAFRPAGPAPPS